MEKILLQEKPYLLSDASTKQIILSDSGKRILRWHLQKEARRLLPEERIAFCMRRMKSSTVDVMYSPEHQSAHYKGLIACGSVWICPICAAYISEKRRRDIEKAISIAHANGCSVYLVTYTIAHKRYDDLRKLLNDFLSARRRSKQGDVAQNVRKKFRILGTISALEVTWSKLNGWHPHCHELVVFESEINIDEYAELVSKQWQKAAEQCGLSMNEHGFRVSKAYNEIANYVAKYGREPLRKMWGAAAEMTKAHLKCGRMKEHLTPFNILALIAQGYHELKHLFREYAHCFKGKHQLVWSPGLRSLLQMEASEKSDLELTSSVPEDNAEEANSEIASEMDEKAILLGRLTYEQWRQVLLKDARGHLLEVARSGNWEQIQAFLSVYCKRSYKEFALGT